MSSKIDPEFQAMIDAAEAYKRSKNKNKKKQRSGQINVFQGVIDNTEPAQISFDYQCGCFGTEHGVVNNCMNCGRVICTREGERPCPYCGTFVFSDATLMDPDLLDQKISAMESRVGKENWKPLVERDKCISTEMPTIDTRIFDLQADWFDDELQEIFKDE